MIRAAEHAEKTGRYIVKLQSDTSHERFQRTLEDALSFSADSTVHAKHEGVFKFFDINLREESLEEVCIVHTVHPHTSLFMHMCID